MLDTIPRKDRGLNDAIGVLNEHLVRCDNDLNRAWSELAPSELTWIESEVDRCLDPQYYCEQYHTIRTERNQLKTLYPMWDHQLYVFEAIKEEFEKNGKCFIIILKPRQAGSTVFNASLMFHRTIFTPNVFTLIVAQNPRTSGHIFKMCFNAYNCLPWWLRPKKLFKQEGEYLEFQEPDDEIRMTKPGLGSSIQIAHSQQMSGVAIGRTVSNFLGSEISRWADPDLFTADIEPSMDGAEFGVMESTAFGRNGLYYDHWQGSMAGDTGWRPVFIPVYRVKKYSLPVKGEFAKTPDEEKFTERVKKESGFEIQDSFWNWRRRRVKSSIASTGAPWAHYESYPITPEEAFQSSGMCAFDKSTLQEQRMQNCCKPLYIGEIHAAMTATGQFTQQVKVQIREVADDEFLPKRKKSMDASDREKQKVVKTDRLYIWELPQPDEFYYVSGDVALGVPDGDYSVGEVFRAGKGVEPDVQVAEWWGHCPPQEFSYILAGLGFWYKGTNVAAEIAVEYKESGITTADKLYELDYPVLYRGRHKDRFQNQWKPFFHWDTNIKTRDLIISTMNEALLSRTVVIRSEDLIDEMFDFGSMGGGRMEGQGNCDDGVMSAQINLYCLREATVGMRAEPNPTKEDDKISNGDIRVYGVFDTMNRQRGQYSDKSLAEMEVSKHKGWKVKPLLICQANTLYSPIFHGSGAERDLHDIYGMHSTQILPEVVTAYRAVNRESVADSDGLDCGDEW